MSLRDTTEQYGSLTKFLHWSLLILVAIQFLLASMMDLYPKGSAAKANVMVSHETVGVLVIAAAVVFVLWRLSNPRPSLASLPAWQRYLARFTHGLIYLLIVLQPLSGILMVVNGDHGLHFFGLTVGSGAGSEVLKEIGETTHGIFPVLILIALGLHLVGALYHHFVARDDVLRRMLPGHR